MILWLARWLRQVFRGRAEGEPTVSGLCLSFFGLTFFDVVEDAGRRKGTPDGGLALGANFGLGGLEAGDVGLFTLADGAIDVLGEEFGVAVVGDHDPDRLNRSQQ